MLFKELRKDKFNAQITACVTVRHPCRRNRIFSDTVISSHYPLLSLLPLAIAHCLSDKSGKYFFSEHFVHFIVIVEFDAFHPVTVVLYF